MTFTPERSEAIRAGLITAAAVGTPRRRRVLAGAALVLAGALLGAGISAAALASTGTWARVSAVPAGQPTPAPSGAVEAPPGHTPGMPITTLLGDPVGQKVVSAAELSLSDRPAEATHVRVTVTCLAVGRISWGPDPGGNNPSSGCDADSVESGAAAWYDFTLDDTVTTLYVVPRGKAAAAVTVQYLAQVPTRFGVNENGQTYGVHRSDQGTPDLIQVAGTAPDGSGVLGYVRASDFGDFSPDHPGLPTNPEEAVRWMEERQQRYPNGWDIPVFEADGTTQIGTFHRD